MKLPPPSTISASVVSFLDDRLRTRQDLSSGAPALASELRSQCFELDRALTGLNSRLESTLLAYSASSDRVNGIFADVSASLTLLRYLTSPLPPDGGGGVRMLGKGLPELAKEVARVETVRAYAETALKLDSLVGDIEDAVSSAMSKNLKKHSVQSLEGTRKNAIEALGLAEDALTSISKTRPQWKRLVLAVDNRIDRALAILRPQAIAEHRNLLVSLGWPPPLSTLTSSNLDMGQSTEIPNPLFTMQGDLRHQYCENFLALCCLQGLQRRRKSRQLEGHYREVALHQPLWAVEELVNPISIACQKKFSKWIDKPEFVFALVYKIARDYVDTMDELLQPLVDEARLVGYSCREEWISAITTSLTTYLAKEIFPRYVGEESDSSNQRQFNASFLHLIDLMIAFDKQIQSLVAQSGIGLSLQEDGNLQKISSLSIFCDRPDWIDLWAQIELGDTLEKLKLDIDDERNWMLKVQGEALLSDFEIFKSPAVSSACFQCLSLVVDRCQSLPTPSMRSRFLKLVGVPIIQTFLDRALLRCQEAEGITALTDDDALIKVACSINASHYFESVLKKRCEDIFFLELGFDHLNEQESSINGSDARKGPIDDTSGGFFNEEIRKLENFREEWVEKISIVILRGFDARCREYMKNRKQWQEKSGGWTVSASLVEALDYLQGKMEVVQEYMNRMDFVVVWRSLASGIDRLIFNGILMSNAKFYDSGVERFSCDLQVLFGVFGAWCLRPESFFPKASDGLKLLKMGEQFQDSLAAVGKWMKENGIRHLNVAEVEKILNCRVFMG